MQPAKFNRGMSLRQLGISIILFFSTFIYSFMPVCPEEKHVMLYWAELLVNHINSGNTGYRYKETFVIWAENINSYTFQSYTDCSGLINSLLKQTYHLDDAFFKTWLGKSRPLARHYFDAILNRNHFKKINTVLDIQPGDLLVIKYADDSAHEDNTGHCMLVASVPVRRMANQMFTVLNKPL